VLVSLKRKFVKWFVWIILMGTGTSVLAQTDTIAIPKEVIGEKKVGEPTRAAFMSAVFPGLGQIYNRKYWKLPIVYGGLAYFISTIVFYDEQYNRYRRNLLYASDNNPDTSVDTEFSRLADPAQTLIRERNRAVRERDYNVILLLLFYGLQVADAAVDAHLKDFDVSDNLAVNLRPAIDLPAVNKQNISQLSWYAGATCTFKLKPKSTQKIILNKISE